MNYSYTVTSLKNTVCAGGIPPPPKRGLLIHKTWSGCLQALTLPPWWHGWAGVFSIELIEFCKFYVIGTIFSVKVKFVAFPVDLSCVQYQIWWGEQKCSKVSFCISEFIICTIHLCVSYVDVCVCSRFGAPSMALVMRALTALTRSRRKVCFYFFLIVFLWNLIAYFCCCIFSSSMEWVSGGKQGFGRRAQW